MTLNADDRAMFPLEGLRVLDFSQGIAGPYATKMLAQFGADVLKVETGSRPDPSRRWDELARTHTQGEPGELFQYLSTCKRIVDLDVNDPGDSAILRRLAAASWLYAVARNECYRRLRAGEVTSALDEAGDMTAEAVDVASAIEQAEVRQFVRDAIAGLNPSERDVIALSLVQGLEADELADALGVSRNHAHARVSRAREQMERSLGALLVARTGREACAALDALLAGWDGQMTVLMRKRVSRHIDQCEICGELKRRELSPALLAGAVPLVALMPGFREHVLKMCADLSSAGLVHRASVAARAGQFGPSGFPKPSLPPGVSGWHRVLRHSHDPRWPAPRPRWWRPGSARCSSSAVGRRSNT